ncbi:MAG: hypothetical protein GXO02_02915 [Epsilonproteobacteria bacterium]|nr:hypothetical protein [Campylobacterota bacterium]
MAKLDLLPPVTVNFKIDSLVNRPQNIGSFNQEEIDSLDGELLSYTFGEKESGLEIILHLVVDKDSKKILDIRYEIFGEPEVVAAASIIALVARNKKIDELKSLNYKGVDYFLREHPQRDAFAPRFKYAVALLLEMLYKIADNEIEKLQNKEVVCKCANITLEVAQDLIKRYKVEEVGELINLSRAGGFCEKCIEYSPLNPPMQYYLTDIIAKVKASLKEKKKVVDKEFSQMSLEEKKDAIEAIIDEHIRHMLVLDGGDMEILDIKENGENTDIYIRYLGACSGCASASTGTLFAIEGILRQKLDPNIRVIPL